MQFYTDPARESESHALPDAEVFHSSAYNEDADPAQLPEGFYWWSCFPGCLPDGEPSGPFETEEEALADAQDA